MGGSCGFCGHVFIVYALYLSVINAVLMSAVTDAVSNNGRVSRNLGMVFLPTFLLRGAKCFLWPFCASRSRKTDALE